MRGCCPVCPTRCEGCTEDEDNPIRPEFRHRYDVSHVTTARFVVDNGDINEFLVIDTASYPFHGGVVKSYGTLIRASRYAGMRNRIQAAGMRYSRLGVAPAQHEAEPLDGWDNVALLRCTR